jgi:hypothetical protein
MYLHANAKLGLAGRFALVKAVEEGSSTPQTRPDAVRCSRSGFRGRPQSPEPGTILDCSRRAGLARAARKPERSQRAVSRI